ncbi:hypothetical protein DL93DRAFT_2134523 [Clavulina sp. PMI_390]|nr:hypothetical protein DL93DRAFT_2134523 [Clavulina sp. PMI_390]
MSQALDPVSALTYALSCPTDSPEQANALKALRALFEAQPNTIPQLCRPLLTNTISGGDSLFKRFAIELFGYALTPTSGLTPDVRAQLAFDCLELAATLLASAENNQILKLVIQCFASIYPLVFRYICLSRPPSRGAWDLLSSSKRRILEFIDDVNADVPNPGAPAYNSNERLGVRIAAIKFAQRVILVQTRPAQQDPRLQRPTDPNLTICPPNVPFIKAEALDAEGNMVLMQLMTTLYKSSNADILIAIINACAQIAKQRTSMVQLLVPAFHHWTPQALAQESISRQKSVDKANYVVLNHLLRQVQDGRLPDAASMRDSIIQALEASSRRMRDLNHLEQVRRAEAAAKRAAEPEDVPYAGSDAKRVKLDPDVVPGGVAANAAARAALVEFDWRALERDTVTNLIIANLQHFSEEHIAAAIAAFRGGSGPPSAAAESSEIAQVAGDDEEMEYEPDKLNMELETKAAEDAASGPSDALEAEDEEEDELTLQLGSTAYELPPPQPLDSAQTDSFLKATMLRFVSSGGGLASSSQSAGAEGQALTTLARGPPPSEMWVLLFIRMVTRGQRDTTGSSHNRAKNEKTEDDEELTLEASSSAVKGKERSQDEVWARNDSLRGMILDYVLEDLPARSRIATLWMNEEWYNSTSRSVAEPDYTDYSTWLDKMLAGYLAHIDSSDRTLSQLVLDLPYLPPSVFALLSDLAVQQSTTLPALEALKELVTLRPPVREEALRIILNLTTHPTTVLRISAIKAVKRWVPDVKPMDQLSQDFAIQLLRRLESHPDPEKGGSTEPTSTPTSTPYLPATLDSPVRPAQILQHVQLIFALCVKVPELLDEIFSAYSRMDEPVQNAVLDHFAPVIRSIGTASGTPAYTRLLDLLRTFEAGADSLVLRVLRILSDGGRPSSQLVALVKTLISERNLDARFLIPIITELDRNEIIKFIPRVVSMLGANVPGSTPGEEKGLVRSVFVAVLEKPARGFGQVSTNLPRLKESQLLEPVRLLVLLHESPEIGMASARDAIDICFGLTDFFPSEILAATIQQLVDNPTLPVLFMRTVIQAVKTYKTLISYVAKTLMTRLIQKKIWTLGKLWDGFILCGKIIAPASYGALLLLPPAQLAEVAEKQPSLRIGLREHVLKKGGHNISKYLDVLGREETPASTDAGAS